jgi:hypothetical protein
MFVVVDRARLEGMINLTRDDHRRAQQTDSGPYFRIEASADGHVRLTGREAEATFPATVYEPGVLFLRITVFRNLLRTMGNTKMLALQVSADGLAIENVRLSLDAGDMLLYPEVATAPIRHPAERVESPPVPAPKKDLESGGLFDQTGN